jgi:two-component system chemotaxis response regulator CheB
MTLEAGTVYIAPGGKHLVVRKVDGKAVTSLNEDPPEQSVRPAADVLFRSLARCQSQRAVLAVVLTGMGEDGLAGLRSLKLTNCLCLTQTEESCVVYGMPRAVDKAGLSDGSIPLDSMAEKMVRLVRGSKVGAR